MSVSASKCDDQLLSKPSDENTTVSEVKDFKTIRRSRAADLTRLLINAELQMKSGRSKATLKQTIKDVEASINSLCRLNEEYIQTLSLESDVEEADEWFHERRKVATEKIFELTRCMEKSTKSQSSVCQSAKVKAVSKKSKSKKSHESVESMNLMLKAERAKLKAIQLKEDAELAIKAADIQALKEKQKATHEVAMAELEAQVITDMYLSHAEEEEDQESQSDSSLYVKEWIHANMPDEGQQRHDTEHKLQDTQEVQPTCTYMPARDRSTAHVSDLRGQERNEAHRVEDHGSYDRQTRVLHQTEPSLNPLAPCFESRNTQRHDVDMTSSQYMGGYNAGRSIDESIDKWIDNLIPGRETVLSQAPVSNQLAHALVKIESERDLPQIDLPKFNGSAMSWPRFIEQFHAQIHCRPGLTDTRRMDLLQSHLEGEARQLVQGLGYSGRNYALALRELKSSFGHRVKVARAFLDRVTSGPVVVSRDPNALRRFYVSLRDCVTTLQQLNYKSDVYSCDTLLKVAQRLPTDKTGKWNEFVKTVVKYREPNLLDLLDWLKDRVDADFNPYAVTETVRKPQYQRFERSAKPAMEKPFQYGKRSTVYNSSSKKSSLSVEQAGSSYRKGDIENVQVPKMPCPMCSQAHYMYRCPVFSNKPVNIRKQIVMDKELCLNCLKPNHQAARCFSNICCREPGCMKRHHTLLHERQDKQQHTSATSNRIHSPPNVVHFQIVPVYVYGPNGVVVHTFALLDSGSDVTLIQESLTKTLGLRGQMHDLTVSTLNKKSTEISMKVSFNLKGADDPDAPVIHVHEAWSVVNANFHCQPQVIDKDWKHLEHLNLPRVKSSQVQILIGMNVPEAHLQTEIITGQEDHPYGIRTVLGWCILGSGAGESSSERVQAHVQHIMTSCEQLSQQVEQFWKTESFGVTYQQALSQEDQRAQEILDTKTEFVNGHYQVPMLWRKDVMMQNNYSSALRRYKTLAKRLVTNLDFELLYSRTLNGYIDKGEAQKLTTDEVSCLTPRTWYIPHHGVTNPNKPGKVRVVFDAAARYAGTCLNDNLITGPDLVSSLFGVLQRFRLYPIAVAADIEGMFHQVKVTPEDTDSLRFLWNADISKCERPDVYKMTVHIFGATDSPCCANYAVKRTAKDNAVDFDETVLRDFYVDDLLKSVDSVADALNISHDVTALLRKGGFRLHKWVTNSPEVLDSIPECDRAVPVKDLDLKYMPVQRALGLKWDVGQDNFIFDSKRKSVPDTKRGVISLVSSIFDPCGFLAPFTLRAKCLIQQLWRYGLDWDDQLPDEFHDLWIAWETELDNLLDFKLPRHHLNFVSQVENIQMHVFSDASERGFGAVAYLRYTSTSDDHDIVVSFVAAKTHVAPIKPELSIPRLELQGAVLVVRLWNTLKDELPLNIERVNFWTDSTTVLQYINNESKRFKPFVQNRVAEIQEGSDKKQWCYISSSLNPADYCTRGLSAKQINLEHVWLSGPEFLMQNENSWLHTVPDVIDHTEAELEVKTKLLLNLATDSELQTDKRTLKLHLSKVINPSDYSSWKRLCSRTAWFLRAVQRFLSTLKSYDVSPSHSAHLTASEFEDAELNWIQEAQRQEFSSEICSLQDGKQLSVKSKLLPLSPVYDGRHLKIGGRLRKAAIPSESKHQLILPARHPVTELLIDDVHRRNAHCGTEFVISEIRQTYWPIKVRQTTRSVINKCSLCRRLKCRPCNPKMANLPICRVTNFQGTFIHTGVDYFGPMYVKIKRSSVKRWGCLFTCLQTRAVHMEVADSLETDDFILVLRRFIARRGSPEHIYSDNGTNFVGANTELTQCLDNLKQADLHNFLTPQHIQWHFNPPASPHFGGAWERLVRSAKSALKVLLKDHSVSESVLRTTLTETEAILNSRPLTHNSDDADDFTALTPNHFIIGRTNVCQPMDVFDEKDLDSRRRWRRVQVLADHINRRWLREYLPCLTVRQRWTTDRPHPNVGDVVIIVDESLPRNQWRLGRISEIFPGDDGRVRTVKVRTMKGEYVRPASKICILEDNVVQ